MPKAYRILADIIAVLVVIQAMAIVFAVAGLFHWIDGGATLDKAVIESWEDDPPTWQGAVGHFLHVMIGTFLIPLLGLAMLVVSFFAKIPNGVKLAAIVFVSILVQVMVGMMAGDAPWLGLVHGLNAFVLFSAAIMAARMSGKRPAETGASVMAS